MVHTINAQRQGRMMGMSYLVANAFVLSKNIRGENVLFETFTARRQSILHRGLYEQSSWQYGPESSTSLSYNSGSCLSISPRYKRGRGG